jgi:hypothetical protein
MATKFDDLMAKRYRMRDRMYPNGYPAEHGSKTCNHVNDMLGAICIIDNKHEGRPHWGPDASGRYHQWWHSPILNNSSLRLLSSGSRFSSARGS